MGSKGCSGPLSVRHQNVTLKVPPVRLRKERKNDTHQSTTDPDARLYRKLTVLGDLPDGDRVTVVGDTNFDTRDLVRQTRDMAATPHVAQYRETERPGRAIDGRPTRHAGYEISQQKRKTVGLLRKLHHRGGPLVDWIFTFHAAAHNLVWCQEG
jgi:hypothetical protein